MKTNGDLTKLTPLQKAVVALKETRARLDAAEQAKKEPVAIVGMGLRFPGINGDCQDPETLWDMLATGGDAVSEVPNDRWDIDSYYSADPEVAGKMHTRWGGFLDQKDQFDAGFFGISPREAMNMDPQQRLLLEVSHEALERAGYAGDELIEKSTGVFIGIGIGDYGQMQLRNDRAINPYSGTGTGFCFASGRLSYVLQTQGPSLSVDTACSSSLVAAHLACQSLRNGECRMALTGGVNMMLSPTTMLFLAKTRALSPTGRCRTFDAAADGFVRGEGCGILVLKRLSDAQADGDRILALIRGSAINHDGPSSGLTVPNGQAQTALLKQALDQACVQASQINYVEAHGTGTALGDPIELKALNAVYTQNRDPAQPLMINSIKTNMGHLEAAAGVAGMIKNVLSLQKRQFPPHASFEKPTPHFSWHPSLKVPTKLSSWQVPDGSPRLAAVSSFGLSGTNAHLIMEEAPPPAARKQIFERSYHLLTLSAKNPTALMESAARWAKALTKENDIGDVCFTANRGRSQLHNRLAFIGTDTRALQKQLTEFVSFKSAATGFQGQAKPGKRLKTAFLFSGQGSQYVGMGRELYGSEPVFRHWINRCEQLLKSHLAAPLTQLLFETTHSQTDLNLTENCQPALFALEYALAKTWMNWGIKPDFVMGHSLGEFVAACIAGVFSLENGLALVAARGRLMQALPLGGGMAAISAEEAIVAEAIAPLGDKLSIAALNGPSNTVISGAGAAVEEMMAHFEAQGIRTKELTVSHAFHSPLMAPMLTAFRQIIAGITLKTPCIGLISNLTGKLAGSEVTDPNYWVRHISEPVRFSAGMETLNQFKPDLLLEIGPQATLLGMGKACVPAISDKDSPTLWLPSMHPKKSNWLRMLESLATIFVAGYRVDWHAFDRGYQRRPLDLPTYPFQRESYWLTPAADNRPQHWHKPLIHPLVHHKLTSPGFVQDIVVFESELSALTPDYMADHSIFDQVVLPGTAFFEMALTAANKSSGKPMRLGPFALHRPLKLENQHSTSIQIVVKKETSKPWSISIFSQNQVKDKDTWHLHCEGEVLAEDQDSTENGIDPSGFWKPEYDPLDIATYYQHAATLGINFGERFRAIDSLWKDEIFVYSKVTLPSSISSSEASHYHLHPVLLDACFQSLGAAFNGDSKNAFLPVAVNGIHVGTASHAKEWWCRAHRKPDEEDGSIRADLSIYDPQGQYIARVEGAQFRRAQPGQWQRSETAESVTNHLYHVGWKPLSKQPDQPTPWERVVCLLIGGTDHLAEILATGLRQRGGELINIRFSGDYHHAPGEFTSINPFDPKDFKKLGEDINEQICGKIAIALFPKDLQQEENPTTVADPVIDASATAAAVLHTVQMLNHECKAESRRIMFLTRGSQLLENDVVALTTHQTSLMALAKTLDLEHPEFAPQCLDLDPQDELTLDPFFHELQLNSKERFIAYRGKRRLGARLLPVQEQQSPQLTNSPPWQLTSNKPGVLDDLVLKPQHRRQPSNLELEIEVMATGLNFKDVLYAMNMLPNPHPGTPLPFGSECSGIVTAVGEGVTEVKPGDEVIALFAPASMASYVTLPAHYVVPKPAHINFQEAATLSTAYLTASYGFHKADLKPGQRVLIHAAAGGVGQAAVQLAKRLGATIFATASPGKHAFLRAMGIEHVYNSRNFDFVQEILTDTKGRGVDTVLNSLNGDYIPKNLEVLTQGGAFIEIGKIGIWSQRQMLEERPDVAYHPFDLSALVQSDMDQLKPLVEQFLLSLQDQSLKPLPLKVFPITQAGKAFRFMAQAKHKGKIVISKGSSSSIRPDATYLITGGCGALGLKVAQWLVTQGARNLLLLGRSMPKESARIAITDLEHRGTRVIVKQADISSRVALNEAIGHLKENLAPLRGIVHAAGVLEDGLLKNLTWAQFEKVLAPKVAGAWNLHQATKDLPLDFFVCFSSVAAMLGSPGQSNYAYANGFLNGFAKWRQSQGLPCVSIAWGSWAESGMAADLTGAGLERHRAAGLHPIEPSWGMEVLANHMAGETAHLGAFPIDWQIFFNHHSQRRTSFFEDLAPQQESTTEIAISARLEALDPRDRRSQLLEFVRNEVASVLNMRPDQVDNRERLFDLGIDSLMALELKNRLTAAFSLSLSQTLVFDYPMVTAIADHLAERLPFDCPKQMEKTSATLTQSTVTHQLDALSENEAEELLMQELEKLNF